MSIFNMLSNPIRDRVVLLTVISALTIEVKTGMTTSRGAQPVAVLKRDFGFTGRQKKVALRYAIEKMQELEPSFAPSARTLEALNK